MTDYKKAWQMLRRELSNQDRNRNKKAEKCHTLLLMNSILKKCKHGETK